jgi:hypothetical protein
MCGSIHMDTTMKKMRPRMRHLMTIALLAVCGSDLAAQAGDPEDHASHAPETGALRLSGSITIDGRLDEAEWSEARAATDFFQREPSEGERATQRTEVRFLFDDEALYVGARMYDDQGAAGVRSRLVRRDADLESDFLRVLIDTYHDHIGYAIFTVNPSGSRQDALATGGGGANSSWDPIWQTATQVDSLGWTAEMRIPFSQLRFPEGTEHTWGLQVDRRVARLNELSSWSFWRQTENGGPSRFGHLTGLEISRRPGRLEALPYVVAQSAHLQPNTPGDPFFDASRQSYRLGLDLRYLLTSNLTLSATVNPDFGQVEVDPAVVNLSAFETFFSERRPFFVEGSGFFGFSPMWCYVCSNVSNLSLFYSRRIGRSPQGAALAYESGDFAEVPQNSTILGAAKITGRTRGGWSIAMLDAVTGQADARVVAGNGEPFRLPVEPRTNYFVGRVKRDLRGSNWTLGAMGTSTVRELPTPELADRLSRHAESFGMDTEAWWKNRTYHLLASAAVTQVSGDPAAMLRIQRSSARYFQRPDRDNGGNGVFTDSYDPSLGTMRGFGLYSRLAKSSGDWLWETGLNVRSPGFENNDIAFLQRADFIWMNANIFRQITVPTRYYRRANVIAGSQQQFNFDGDLTDRQFHLFGDIQLPNYWNVSSYNAYRPAALDDRLARGGPMLMRAGSLFQNLSISTDARRPVVVSTNPSWSRNDFGATGYSVNLDVRVRPASNVLLSVGPAFSRSASSHQYVTAVTDPTAESFFGRRYVFGDLVQKTASMDTRLNVTMSPTLSFELFAQPFASAGRYSAFKEFAAPRSRDLLVYGTDAGVISRRSGAGRDVFEVDPDGSGPAAPFTFTDPDFNFRSLRGNAVVRWEYRPGSTLFFVWTQDRSDSLLTGDLNFSRDRHELFSAKPNNIFLIKANYWLGR